MCFLSCVWIAASQSSWISQLRFQMNHLWYFMLFLVKWFLYRITDYIVVRRERWPNKHQRRYRVLPPVVGSVTPDPIYCVSSRCYRRASSLKSTSECMCCGATSWRSCFHQAGWWAQETAAVIWCNVVSATVPLQARGVVSLWFVNHTPTLGWNIFDQCLGLSFLTIHLNIDTWVRMEEMKSKVFKWL